MPQTRNPEGTRGLVVNNLVSSATQADGINLHGGHHNVLIEGCEMSFTGDDPYGLWPVSADAREDTFSCQQNIVLRNNVARWVHRGEDRRRRPPSDRRRATAL